MTLRSTASRVWTNLTFLQFELISNVWNLLLLKPEHVISSKTLPFVGLSCDTLDINKIISNGRIHHLVLCLCQLTSLQIS